MEGSKEKIEALNEIPDGLTAFQKRKLQIVAQKMNDKAKELNPGLTDRSDLFRTCVKFGDDDESYAIVPDYSVCEDEGLIAQILEEFDDDIRNALSFFNPLRECASEMVSLVLWQVEGLFKIANRPPFFKLKSGALSPFYLDLGVLPSWCGFMNLISSLMQIETDMVLQNVDIVIGGETRGIAFTDRLGILKNLGVGIARKEVKKYGTGKGVEGCLIKGDRVALVDEMITDGGSKEAFVENIKRAGGKVVVVIVVFDRKQGGAEFLEKSGIPMISLTDIYTFLEIGLKYEYIEAEEYRMIMDYLEDPAEWNKRVAAESSCA